MGTRREVAVKPSYGTGHLGTGSNASATLRPRKSGTSSGLDPAAIGAKKNDNGVVQNRVRRCPDRIGQTPEAHLGQSVTTRGEQTGRRGRIRRIRARPEPIDIRAAAPRGGATSYGPLLRVHGGTATRRVRESQENGSPMVAKRPPRAPDAARDLDCGGWATTLGDDTPLSRTQHVDKGVDKCFGWLSKGKVIGVDNA